MKARWWLRYQKAQQITQTDRVHSAQNAFSSIPPNSRLRQLFRFVSFRLLCIPTLLATWRVPKGNIHVYTLLMLWDSIICLPWYWTAWLENNSFCNHRNRQTFLTQNHLSFTDSFWSRVTSHRYDSLGVDLLIEEKHDLSKRVLFNLRLLCGWYPRDKTI